MNMSPAVGQLAKALSAAQGEMPGAVKDANNPFFKSKYADISSIKEASQQHLTKHGLAIVCAPSSEGARVTVTTVLMHESGEWISCSLSATAKDESPQSTGSCVTYLRRYGIQSLLNIASEDDDGEAAQDRSTHRPQPVRREILRDIVDGKVRTVMGASEVEVGNQPVSSATPASPPDKEMLARKARVDKLKKAKGDYFVQWAETTLGHLLPERLSLLTVEQINTLEAAIVLEAKSA
jgi:hypothetical protein